jgi:hypothetical protein
MARQASAERAWASISRFYENVKKGVKGRKVGLPKFQQNCRSVEYKTNSGKLADDRKSITFTDIAILAGVVNFLPHPSPPRTRGPGVRNSQMI